MVKLRDLAVDDCGIESMRGNPELEILRAASLDRTSAGSLTFVKAQNLSETADDLTSLPTGSAVVCRASLAAEIERGDDLGLLISEQPRLSFMRLVARFFPPERAQPGVHPSAIVHETAVIDPAASVGPCCVIGESCEVGPGTVLHSGVVLQRHVRIGRNVTVHASSVLGADGFGYERGADGTLEKFPHLGGVLVEDDVEIGSNTSIDRGSLGDTVLSRGCKIDNQVHVAHNVVVGQDAVIIAQAMIGGSVRIGERAWIAPAAVILNQVSVGDDALVGLGAVVTRDVPAGTTVLGAPAVPEAEFHANRSALKSLLQGERR